VSACPLCASPFPSFTDLFGSIRKDKADVLALTEQEKIIENKQEAVTATKQRLEQVGSAIATVVSDRVKQLKEKLEDKQQIRVILNDKTSASKRQQGIHEQQIIISENYFSDILSENITPNIANFNLFKAQQEKVLKEMKAELAPKAQKVADDERIVSNKQNELDVIDANIAIVDTKQKALKADDIYVRTNELLTKYKAANLYGVHSDLNVLIKDEKSSKALNETRHTELLALQITSLESLKNQAGFVEKAALDDVVKELKGDITVLQTKKMLLKLNIKPQ
jgi:hypothetical protein